MDAGSADEVGITVNIGTLDSNRLKSVFIKRAVDHIALQIIIGDLIPGDVDVAIVPLGLNVLGRTWASPYFGRYRRGGAAVVNLDFIDDQRARRVICFTLAEVNTMQLAGLKRVDRCGFKSAKR